MDASKKDDLQEYTNLLAEREALERQVRRNAILLKLIIVASVAMMIVGLGMVVWERQIVAPQEVGYTVEQTGRMADLLEMTEPLPR